MEKLELTDFKQTIHLGSPDAPAQELQWKLTEGSSDQGVFTIPEKLGKGRLAVCVINPTIAYAELEICFDRDVALERPDFSQQYSILYCGRGGMRLLSRGQKREQGVGSLLYCDSLEAEPDRHTRFLFQAGVRTRMVMFMLYGMEDLTPQYHHPILQAFEEERERGVTFPCIARLPEIARIFERSRPCKEKDTKARKTVLTSKLVAISAILMEKGIGQVQESVRGISPEERATLEHARLLLMRNFSCPPTISQIARQVGMNETKLKREFKQFYGLPVYRYFKRAKMERAMDLLTSTDLSIREIAFRCGYDSQSQFSAAFREIYNLAPLDAHKKFRNFYR